MNLALKHSQCDDGLRRFMAGVGAALCVLVSAGCGPAATFAPFSTDTPQPRTLAPEFPSTASAHLGASASPSAEPFAVELTPLPTETALPPIELPTEAPAAPALQVWDGAPSYPAESRPGFYFRVRYDPDLWAVTTDQYGFPALAGRNITDCVITPSAGRGMPLNGSVDHDVRRINGLSFQINTAYLNGVRQFVNYAAGVSVIYTAFEVAFGAQADECLLQAETVLGTLRAVPIAEATPIATP